MKKVEAGPEEESVWDYPRPPALEQTDKTLRVEFNNIIIAETHCGMRVLETSQAPAYYFPPQDIQIEYLEKIGQTTFCEWKGQACYYDVLVKEQRVQRAAWYYPDPTKRFKPITNYIAFYPNKLDCYVDGEKAKPNEGGFYGGWITSDIVGPFKGGSGTAGW